MVITDVVMHSFKFHTNLLVVVIILFSKYIGGIVSIIIATVTCEYL